MTYNHNPFAVFDPLQQSSKRKVHSITYKNDDLFGAFPRNQQHADHHHATLRPRHPPRFISCPNGTLLSVLSHNNCQKILDTSRKDLENILLLQGQFYSRRLWQMSEVFTHNAQEEDLLQGSQALEFVKTLHWLYCLLQPILIQSNHLFSTEGFIESLLEPPTYKQKEYHLCFGGDFDNDSDADWMRSCFGNCQ